MNALCLGRAAVIKPAVARADCVALAKGGDTAAFERLYHENSGRVYAVCLRMTGNTAEAEDLTQEAFVRAWKKLSTFRGDSAFSTWLHRLTVNLVLTNRRSHTRRTSRETSTGDLSQYEGESKATAPGLRMDIEAAIDTLPERARQVFVLHDVEGYRHDEIAEMMGVATGTTKAQLHRARKLLREVLV